MMFHQDWLITCVTGAFFMYSDDKFEPFQTEKEVEPKYSILKSVC